MAREEVHSVGYIALTIQLFIFIHSFKMEAVNILWVLWHALSNKGYRQQIWCQATQRHGSATKSDHNCPLQYWAGSEAFAEWVLRATLCSNVPTLQQLKYMLHTTYYRAIEEYRYRWTVFYFVVSVSGKYLCRHQLNNRIGTDLLFVCVVSYLFWLLTANPMNIWCWKSYIWKVEYW